MLLQTRNNLCVPLKKKLAELGAQEPGQTAMFGLLQPSVCMAKEQQQHSSACTISIGSESPVLPNN